MNRLKSKIRTWRINIERRIYRIRRNLKLKRLERVVKSRIEEAERRKFVSGKRHYVVKFGDDIYCLGRHEIKEANKKLDRLAKLSIAQIYSHIIYQTK